MKIIVLCFHAYEMMKEIFRFKLDLISSWIDLLKYVYSFMHMVYDYCNNSIHDLFNSVKTWCPKTAYRSWEFNFSFLKKYLFILQFQYTSLYFLQSSSPLSPPSLLLLCLCSEKGGHSWVSRNDDISPFSKTNQPSFY